MKALHKYLTYANVMATVAVFLALGGTAWALAKHSVGKQQLKSSAVTTKKIKNLAVTNAKLGNGAVNAAKIADGSIKAVDIDLGALSNNVVARRADVSVDPMSQDFARASCQAGERATGGGAWWNGSPDNQNAIIDSYPESAPSVQAANGGVATIWVAEGFNADASPNVLTVFVMCISP
jgi:hypothetical protein